MVKDAVLDQTIRSDLAFTDREKIRAVESALAKAPDAFFGDTDKCPLTHKFADNCYIREIFIPKGTMVVGKIHKHKHPNFLMKGKVSVFTEQNGVEELEAPLSMVSEPGTKRVVYAHEDTVWITVHVTDKTDLDEIEEEVISPSYEDYDKLQEQAMLYLKGE